ncbi:hypothetical protein ACWD3E_43175, partial [Streptomyces sp. NPDC002676]
ATAARAAGITGCFHHFELVEVLLDDGYLGLSSDHPGQALTPPRKPRPGALPGRVEQWERDRHDHSSPADAGFVPQPKRWIVEQTNGILMLHRRLVRDYEHRSASAESRVYWVISDVIARRLTGSAKSWRGA